ncbi:MAG: cupin-like domain-containing protein [Pseudomonadota bacterium]
MRETQVLTGIAPDAIPYRDLLDAQQPAILKGVARDWPLVRRGLESPAAAIATLKAFDGGRPVTGFTGAPAIKGRFFYDETATALNFEAARVPLAEFLDRLAAHLDDPDSPSFYIGSTDLDLYFPGLRAGNTLALDDSMFANVIASIWIGNRTTASAHYDMSNNLAVCVAGHRRFTLFPPGQIANLYPGPLDPTPGGQVVSMVDFTAPDPARHPRFAEALAAGEVAALDPGDALFYPALWWHHVEALDAFNILINYWWNPAPAFMDTPQNTLLHALLSLRDRPEAEKAGWRALFDYYVFGPAERPAAHLPEAARGNLAPMDEMKARRLRATLLNRLNR